jgi:hypothetical protein
VVVVVAAVAVVEGEGNNMRKEINMSRKNEFVIIPILIAAIICGLSVCVYSAPLPSDTTTAAKTQKAFATPQLAADALIQATSDYNVGALLQIFGPEGEDFVQSKDPVRDKNQAMAFAKLAQEKNSVTVDPNNPNRATLVVGNEDWPLPVPLVKKGASWVFDSKAGRKEILDRRIGANELDAIQVCHGYVDAQKEYASIAHDGVNQYAQRIISTPGKQDGLFWLNADGTPGGPIGESIAKAIAEGYSSKAEPYHGYYFKILKGQGPAAPIGQIDYVIEGIMIGGFALAAVPAEYRVTGVKTFIVSNGGVVHQKDLGQDSLELFQKMELYNPDKTWQTTDDQWPANAWVAAANQ